MGTLNYDAIFEIEIKNNISWKRFKYLYSIGDSEKPKLYNKLKKQDKKKWRKTLRNHFNWCKYCSLEKRTDGKHYYIKW